MKTQTNQGLMDLESEINRLTETVETMKARNPTRMELEKYMREITSRIGFSFSAREDRGMMDRTFRDDSDYYWSIIGKLPLEDKGNTISLEKRTEQGIYFDPLKYEEVKIHYRNAKIVTNQRKSISYEDKYKGFSLFNGSESESVMSDDNRLNTLKNLLICIEKRAKLLYPTLFEILATPHSWAIEHYGKPFSIDSEMKLLRENRKWQHKLNKLSLK